MHRSSRITNRIIIPWTSNPEDEKANSRILENLENITREQFESLWASLKENRESKLIEEEIYLPLLTSTGGRKSLNSKKYTYKEIYNLSNYLDSMLKLTLVSYEKKRDFLHPKLIDWVPIFICKSWWKYCVFLWYDCIGENFDDICPIDGDALNIWWKPFIVAIKDEKFIIIRWDKTINLSEHEKHLEFLKDKSWEALFEFENIPVFFVKKDGKLFLNMWLTLYEQQWFDNVNNCEIVWNCLYIFGTENNREKVLKIKQQE